MPLFGPLTLRCIVAGCGHEMEVESPVLPAGWTETQDGAVCPRHQLRVDVEDVPVEDAHETALSLDARRAS